MAKKYFWNDDTQSLSWKGKDFVAGEPIPAEYIEEQEEKFDKFCQNQQISNKPKVTFSEKQQAALINSRSVVDKLRVRIIEQTEKIKSLEKKVEDFEVSFDELSDLDSGKEEIKQLKAEKKYLGECFAALEDEKTGLDIKLDNLATEKADWEKLKTNKKELEKLAKAVK